jgi:MoaA/NifB/PqqE/SkfB family radical SAM enzyme
MLKRLSVLKGFLKGDIKMCEFALTNVCTAKCNFCSIWKQKPKVIADTENTLRAIAHLSKIGVRFITLTGGEPLIHPHLERIIEHCSDHHIITAVLKRGCAAVHTRTDTGTETEQLRCCVHIHRPSYR